MVVLKYILSSIYYLAFGLVLVIMQPIQWLGLKLGGYHGHNKIINVLNYVLVQILKILGVTVSFENSYDLPTDRPIVFVSNHQSLYDISAMASHFSKHQVKFVAKKELGKGIPTISFNLRHGGSVLIDRKDRRQALTALKNFAEYLESNKRSAVIYPEGTRSRNGKPKKFSKNGLQMILKYCPSALVVPVTINNSWKVVHGGPFPLNLGIKIVFKIHEPIENGALSFDELFEKVETAIVKDIIN